MGQSTDLLKELKNKNFWREKNSHLWCFYCPSCRAPKRLPYRPQPGGFKHFFQVGITSIVFTIATWPFFTWKGIISFLPFWIVFETFYRGRIRTALVCSSCGFDPFLYLTDVDLAKRDIEIHWRRKFAEKGIPFPEKNSPPNSNSGQPDSKIQIEP